MKKAASAVLFLILIVITSSAAFAENIPISVTPLPGCPSEHRDSLFYTHNHVQFIFVISSMDMYILRSTDNGGSFHEYHLDYLWHEFSEITQIEIVHRSSDSQIILFHGFEDNLEKVFGLNVDSSGELVFLNNGNPLFSSQEGSYFLSIDELPLGYNQTAFLAKSSTGSLDLFWWMPDNSITNIRISEHVGVYNYLISETNGMLGLDIFYTEISGQGSILRNIGFAQTAIIHNSEIGVFSASAQSIYPQFFDARRNGGIMELTDGELILFHGHTNTWQHQALDLQGEGHLTHCSQLNRLERNLLLAMVTEDIQTNSKRVSLVSLNFDTQQYVLLPFTISHIDLYDFEQSPNGDIYFLYTCIDDPLHLHSCIYSPLTDTAEMVHQEIPEDCIDIHNFSLWSVSYLCYRTDEHIFSHIERDWNGNLNEIGNAAIASAHLDDFLIEHRGHDWIISFRENAFFLFNPSLTFFELPSNTFIIDESNTENLYTIDSIGSGPCLTVRERGTR